MVLYLKKKKRHQSQSEAQRTRCRGSCVQRKRRQASHLLNFGQKRIKGLSNLAKQALEVVDTFDLKILQLLHDIDALCLPRFTLHLQLCQ